MELAATGFPGASSRQPEILSRDDRGDAQYVTRMTSQMQGCHKKLIQKMPIKNISKFFKNMFESCMVFLLIIIKNQYKNGNPKVGLG